MMTCATAHMASELVQKNCLRRGASPIWKALPVPGRLDPKNAGILMPICRRNLFSESNVSERGRMVKWALNTLVTMMTCEVLPKLARLSAYHLSCFFGRVEEAFVL